MAIDEKYVVFKRKEFDDWYDSLTEISDSPPSSVEDAVVIRRQDVFAPPALDAYANSIQACIEIMDDVFFHDAPEAIFDTREQMERAVNQNTRLRAIADYFHEQAAVAWDTDRKLPD